MSQNSSDNHQVAASEEEVADMKNITQDVMKKIKKAVNKQVAAEIPPAATAQQPSVAQSVAQPAAVDPQPAQQTAEEAKAKQKLHPEDFETSEFITGSAIKVRLPVAVQHALEEIFDTEPCKKSFDKITIPFVDPEIKVHDPNAHTRYMLMKPQGVFGAVCDHTTTVNGMSLYQHNLTPTQQRYWRKAAGVCVIFAEFSRWILLHNVDPSRSETVLKGDNFLISNLMNAMRDDASKRRLNLDCLPEDLVKNVSQGAIIYQLPVNYNVKSPGSTGILKDGNTAAFKQYIEHGKGCPKTHDKDLPAKMRVVSYKTKDVSVQGCYCVGHNVDSYRAEVRKEGGIYGNLNHFVDDKMTSKRVSISIEDPGKEHRAKQHTFGDLMSMGNRMLLEDDFVTDACVHNFKLKLVCSQQVNWDMINKWKLLGVDMGFKIKVYAETFPAGKAPTYSALIRTGTTGSTTQASNEKELDETLLILPRTSTIVSRALCEKVAEHFKYEIKVCDGDKCILTPLVSLANPAEVAKSLHGKVFGGDMFTFARLREFRRTSNCDGM